MPTFSPLRHFSPRKSVNWLPRTQSQSPRAPDYAWARTHTRPDCAWAHTTHARTHCHRRAQVDVSRRLPGFSSPPFLRRRLLLQLLLLLLPRVVELPCALRLMQAAQAWRQNSELSLGGPPQPPPRHRRPSPPHLLTLLLITTLPLLLLQIIIHQLQP
jgi:hypothetical protein